MIRLTRWKTRHLQVEDTLTESRNSGMHILAGSIFSQTYFEGLADSTGRQHPWMQSTINPDWKYHDFKKTPELVSQVLEDFKPWDHYDSVQLF